MIDPDDVFIAGFRKVRDWNTFRSKLTAGDDQALWGQAFREFYHPRLRFRYLLPIETLQQHDILSGEGFSIMTIQCSLIEFLESTVQGKSYRYVKNPQDLEEFEYCNSKEVFVNFLTERQPFSSAFNRKEVAVDFYEGVRCGLLHEAQTKNGWIIRGNGPSGKLIELDEDTIRIVYRNEFHNALLKFIEWYGQTLPVDASLQEAFIRKFDSLCQ